jgi:hypothetical protein
MVQIVQIGYREIANFVLKCFAWNRGAGRGSGSTKTKFPSGKFWIRPAGFLELGEVRAKWLTAETRQTRHHLNTLTGALSHLSANRKRLHAGG